MATRPITGALEIRPFRAEDLTGLLRGGTPPCVSIYLTTHRKHPEWKQDPVRFRGLVAEAEALLGKSGARDAKAAVERLRALTDEAFWEFALEGLAVFLSGGAVTIYRLPMPVEDRVVVADTFHTKPLLRFLRANKRYFVLAVSQNAVSLYEGSSFGAGSVELRGVPASLRDALGVPVHDRMVTSHGRSGFVFHGRGPGREEEKEEMLKFFRAIDRGLREFLRDERSPLLVASVAYYHPIYREANTYPYLLAAGIDGNFERTNGDGIHAAAWPIVERHFASEIERWVARYRETAGTGLGSDRLDDVAQAAVRGRVRCLFAAEGSPIWGVLDRSTGEITLHPRQMNERDGDLVDDVCEEAYRRGAEVLVLPPGRMPTSQPVAAVYRF
jgi:hypothetical protein